MTFLELLKLPNNEGRDGIHICAQLRVDAMQLQSYRVGWASNTMERAAKYIETLEDMLVSKASTESTDD